MKVGSYASSQFSGTRKVVQRGGDGQDPWLE